MPSAGKLVCKLRVYNLLEPIGINILCFFPGVALEVSTCLELGQKWVERAPVQRPTLALLKNLAPPTKQTEYLTSLLKLQRTVLASVAYTFLPMTLPGKQGYW